MTARVRPPSRSRAIHLSVAEQFVYDVFFPAQDGADPTVAQLWAQRRVADLLTELRIEGARDSLVAEIVEVATQFGIVTPYTSYLAEEPEMAFRDDLAADSIALEANAALRCQARVPWPSRKRSGELAEGTHATRWRVEPCARRAQLLPAG